MELEQSNAPSYNFNQSFHLNLSFYFFKDITKVTFFIQVFLPDLYYTRTVQDHQELMPNCMNNSLWQDCFNTSSEASNATKESVESHYPI